MKIYAWIAQENVGVGRFYSKKYESYYRQSPNAPIAHEILVREISLV